MSERIPQSTTKRIPFIAYLAGTLNPATGKTIPVTISLNGAAFGNPSGGATNATQIGNGWYYFDASTTDTGTLGPLLVHGAEGTIDNVDLSFTVIVPDAANVTQALGTGVTATGGIMVVNAENSVWDAVRASHVTAGTFGGDVVDESTLVSDIRTDMDANSKLAPIKVTTDRLTFTVTNQVDSNVLDWKSATAPAMTGDAYAALVTATYAEPGQGVPLATTTLVEKIGYVFKAWRNKSEQTAVLYALFNAAGSTVDQKAIVSFDGTTFTRFTIATGP